MQGKWDWAGLPGENGKEHGNYYIRYWCSNGILGRNMESTVWGLEFCWMYIGILEKNMETIVSSIGVIIGKMEKKMETSI